MAIGGPWLSGCPNRDDNIRPSAIYTWDTASASWEPYIARSQTAVRSVIPAGTTDRLILATGAFRRGGIIHNNSSGMLYLALGAAPASTTSFSVRLATQTTFNIPFGYTGEIRGVWSNNNGNAQVTSLE